MKNGRITDVIVEWQDDLRYVDVWADEGSKELIENVEGVTNCYNNLSEVNYHVYLDPRYDKEFVMKEIEAAIKVGNYEN